MTTKDVTGAEVQSAMIAADISKADCHECSGCGYMTAYVRQNTRLFFDPGCYCTTGGGFEPRSWDDAAGWINMQSNPEIRAKIAERFGISQ